MPNNKSDFMPHLYEAQIANYVQELQQKDVTINKCHEEIAQLESKVNKCHEKIAQLESKVKKRDEIIDRLLGRQQFFKN